MLKKNFLVAALMLSGLAFSAGVAAQNYIGAGAGHAQWNIDCAGATKCEKGATAFKVFGGRDLSPLWAVEGGFFSLGKVAASDGYTTGEFQARGVEVAGLIKTPSIKGFIGFGKLGVAVVKGETKATFGNARGTANHNSNQAVYGFGLMYQLNNDIRLRADVERRDVRLADFDSAKGAVTNVTIGLQASF